MQGVLLRRPQRKDAVLKCDLCRTPAKIRFEVKEFGYGEDERACGQCREGLRQERAEKRQAEVMSRPVPYVSRGESHPHDHRFALPIYGDPVYGDPTFQLEEMIPRAACHWHRLEAKRALASIRELAWRATP